MYFLFIGVFSYYWWFLSYPIHVKCSSVERRSSRATPWQQNSLAKREASPFLEDSPPNVFAPHGRLYQVEDAVHAVSLGSDPSSTSLIAMQCKDGILVVTTSPQSPYLKHTYKCKDAVALGASLCLLDDGDRSKEHYSTIPPFFRLQWPRLSPHHTSNDTPLKIVLAVTAGNAVESQIVRHRIHQTSQRLRQSLSTSELGSSDWIDCLARILADQQQQRTQILQGATGRLVAATAVLLGNNKIYRIDPTGTFWICQAVVVGRHASRIEQCLLDRLLEKRQGGETVQTPLRRQEICTLVSQLTIDEAIHMATECLLEGIHDGRSSEKAPLIRLRAIAISSSGSSEGGAFCYSTRELLAMVRPESFA